MEIDEKNLKIDNNNAESVYIHIPFCKRKCNYCAFISYTDFKDFEDVYVDALIKEIENFSSPQKIKTIYFGGGTPNLLSLKNIEKILNVFYKNFDIDNDAEITMEINPKISDLSYLKSLKNFEINRISIGVQSFNNKTLKILNRIHNSKDIFDTISNVQKAGFNNYSIDLMYGIFSQTLNDVKSDLKIVKSILPPHISTYGLKIEKNTPFDKMDKTNLPNEDLCADMYSLISKTLINYGYNHYEISNFARENYQSKHNLTYWKAKEYFGFGLSSHGFLNGIRYSNTKNLNDYIKNPFAKEEIKMICKQEKFEEYVMLGLRLSAGIDFNYILKTFAIDLYEEKKDKFIKFEKYGYGNLKNNGFSLTTNGFLISNYIIGEIIY